MMAEWAWAMFDGPGHVVLRNAFDDLAAVDAATEVFFAIIDEQRRDNKAERRPFRQARRQRPHLERAGKAGAARAGTFARYYANEAIAMVSRGVARDRLSDHVADQFVNPGGAAQSAHRDYHMGFQSAEEIARFPVHAHLLSPFLTLQGAVAHCDMPLESGPTLLSAVFADVTRPAISPIAGRNSSPISTPTTCSCRSPKATPRSSIRRCSTPPATTAPPTCGGSPTCCSLLGLWPRDGIGRPRQDGQGALSLPCAPARTSTRAPVANVIAACAEGYAFPTNLDRDPPLDGLAPPSQAALMTKALAEGWDAAKFSAAVDEHAARRLT